MNIQKPADSNNLTPLEQTHWPQIEPYKPKVGIKFSVKVKVGKVPHVMTSEHQIVYIELFYGNKPIGKKFLKPGDKPEIEFEVMAKKPDKLIAYEFCNLHGLWGNELAVS